MESVRATVIMPTTGDRSAVLPHAVASVLRQTVADLELFIVGDGAAPASCQVIRRLQGQDPRIRFFDHPKGPRRGEQYRHTALAEARGTIVAYLCDRDLMLPWHLHTLLDLLGEADFAHTLRFRIAPDGALEPVGGNDLAVAADRQDLLKGWRPGNGVGLSLAGHTLAMYRRLPHGWRQTPEGLHTDFYMWQQFLARPECRAVSGTRPTVLTFLTSLRSGWTAQDRARELDRWERRMATPDWYPGFLEELVAALERDRLAAMRARSLPLAGRLRQSGLATTAGAAPGLRRPARWLWRRIVKPALDRG
jgi:hypothetical protein